MMLSVLKEHHGQVVNTPALYLGSPSLNLSSETSLTAFSWFSSAPPGKCWDNALKLGHYDSCTAFPIHRSLIAPSYDAMYSATGKAKVNYKQIVLNNGLHNELERMWKEAVMA
jgi:hypothetical protein